MVYHLQLNMYRISAVSTRLQSDLICHYCILILEISWEVLFAIPAHVYQAPSSSVLVYCQLTF